MRIFSSLLLTCLFFLGGCSSSLFESLPEGTVMTCDPALPGRWIVTRTESAADNALPRPLEIAADCRTVTDQGQAKPIQANFVHTRAGNYVEALNDSGKLDCAGDNDTYCGHFLLRYEIAGDQMRLYMPDHARIAQALTRGQVKGYQYPQPETLPAGQERTYHNFVAGNPAQIARILRRHPEFFVTEPTTVLVRDTAPPAAPAPTTPEATAPAPPPETRAAPQPQTEDGGQ